jgi:crotonobetainyl-CoA:carnitine CoA-transferase CaiB-like acyl-CoA transferase
MTTTKPDGALAGFKVIDLTRVLGGPYCTQILADHGAEVIKVEPPQGDETRDWGPPFRDQTASYYLGVNRNKRTIALDFTKQAGQAVLLRLLGDADVLIHNLKWGTLEKWGLGYEAVLQPRFPRLIYCHISGFGGDGPHGGRPGYDAVVQAMCGLMGVNGTPETGPLRLGTPMVDLGAGLNAVIGILLAAQERQRSGRGQSVEVTLYDSGVALLHPQAANWFMSGRTPQPIGNAHPNVSPYDQFATATRPIFLAVGNDRQFAWLCAELEAPELADDPRFRDNAGRVTNRDALRQALVALLAEHDGQALADRLLARGVPAGAVLTVPEVMNHPHSAARAMVVEDGEYRGTGIPIKFGRTGTATASAPRRFGADGRAILAEAGYGADEIEALAEAGILVERRRR